MSGTLPRLLGEALTKAEAVEHEITERLAHMVLERDHPRVQRQGMFAFQVTRLRAELVEAQGVTDALRASLARAATRSAEPVKSAM
jgi:hypothetical protein